MKLVVLMYADPDGTRAMIAAGRPSRCPPRRPKLRTTTVCDRRRQNLYRHAAHAVVAFVTSGEPNKNERCVVLTRSAHGPSDTGTRYHPPTLSATG